ncbi:MAG: S-layer homology domain-containing protein [Cyanobacteria bacterium J06636_16]
MVVRKVAGAIAGLVLFSGLAACAGSPLGSNVERSLEADPQLEESPAFEGTSDAEEAGSRGKTSGADAATEGTDTEDSASSRSTDTEATDDDSQDEVVSETTASASDDRLSDVEEPDLAGVPTDLRSYIEDLQALDLLVLQPADAADSEGSDTAPNSETSASPFTQSIARREYARWLWQTHNALYEDEPSVRLRAGVATDEPVFQDVPATDPDFAAIQGLAEAGIIPSALTGNSTAVNFRPNAPLTREALILWKVPLDRRSTLPETSPETVTELWGFQDTASIEPFALKAIAADHQLGDFANIRRAFGYTTLFQPDKAVTRAEAAAVLWRFGTQTDGRSAADAVGSEGVEE